MQLEAPVDRDQKLRTLIKDCFFFSPFEESESEEDSRRRRNISFMTSAFYFWVAAAAAAASVCCQLFLCPLTETNENKSQLLTKLNVYSSFVRLGYQVQWKKCSIEVQMQEDLSSIPASSKHFSPVR